MLTLGAYRSLCEFETELTDINQRRKGCIFALGAGSRDSEKALEDARAVLEGAGLSVDTAILPGQPDAVLGKRVEELGARLVAMGAYGHSRIRSVVIGSTPSELLRSCKAPVLLMR
ncbi:universal stress protein [Hoeflea sp.]|uniref:universal stress protein n=1 Tax=Hoeflea sp. TaxID=1940281 RepID=UPI0019955B8C|nr:universal stress protein [Hoeflea sp.]MBC7280691.1 universal stress protein [Hoeflea sp.]